MDEPWMLAEEPPPKRAFDPRVMVLTCVATFTLILGVFSLVTWWSGAALRANSSNAATYVFTGVVKDAATGEPVPWATVEDDPRENSTRYRAQAGFDGTFTLHTYVTHHHIIVSASGYKPLILGVGRQWYAWWPNGQEQRVISMSPR